MNELHNKKSLVEYYKAMNESSSYVIKPNEAINKEDSFNEIFENAT